MDKRVTVLLSHVIILVFVTSFLVDIFVKTYDPPEVVYWLVTALAGAVYGGVIRKPRRDQPENENA